MPDIYFRPLDRTTWVRDGKDEYVRCPFRASYVKTLAQLRYELERLGAERATVEIDYDGADLRLDGMPRASARPLSPRVRVSFEAPGIGPQCYMCETYPHWQENLRGVVMTLDRLRAIERYGATRGKQQYKGWAGLPEKATDGFGSPADAAAFLSRHSGADEAAVLRDPGAARSAYRAAAARLHPDKGGTADMMSKLNAARKVLSHA